jgi:hypothetical protein
LRMLVLSSLIMAVICLSMPARSSQNKVSFTGYPPAPSSSRRAHSTVIRRSDSYIRLVTFGQLRA